MSKMGLGLHAGGFETSFGIVPLESGSSSTPVMPPGSRPEPLAASVSFTLAGYEDPSYTGFTDNVFSASWQTTGTIPRPAFPPVGLGDALPASWFVDFENTANHVLSLLRVYQLTGTPPVGGKALIDFGTGVGTGTTIDGVTTGVGPDLVEAVKTGARIRITAGPYQLAFDGLVEATDSGQAGPFTREGLGAAGADFAKRVHISSHPDNPLTPQRIDVAYGNDGDGNPLPFQSLSGVEYTDTIRMVHLEADGTSFDTFREVWLDAQLPKSTSGAGRWLMSTRTSQTTHGVPTSTSSATTGPTSDNVLPYVYGTSRGSPFAYPQRDNNSSYVLNSQYVPAGTGRVMQMLVCMQGVGFQYPETGLHIQTFSEDPLGGTTSLVGTDTSQVSLHLVRGWNYARDAFGAITTRAVGTSFQDYGGSTRSVAAPGGWISVIVPIVDQATHVAFIGRWPGSRWIDSSQGSRGADTHRASFAIAQITFTGDFL